MYREKKGRKRSGKAGWRRGIEERRPGKEL